MRAPAAAVVSISWALVWGLSEPAAAHGQSREYKTVRIPYEHPGLPLAARFEGPSARIIFVDGCFDGGCELEPYEDDAGNLVEDSRRGYSSILDEPVVIPEFPYGRDRFGEIAACVRRIFGPFEVEVTTEAPGDVPHWRHVMAGSPEDAGFPGNHLGVSPYDFQGCLPIPNAISYGFPELVGDDVVELCELAAHEIGHSLGLDHALLCSDPMTYLEPCGPKSFQDEDAECGEHASRPCQCSERQNTYRLLMSEFGERQHPAVAVSVRSPAAGAEVSPGYRLEIDVDSEVPDRVELSLNSQHTAVLEGAELSFAPPDGVSDGVHRYEIVSYDQYGSRAKLTHEVIQGSPCSAKRDCGGGEACVDGRCVPGPGVEGGLGEPCAGDEGCLSGRCSIDPDREVSDSPSGFCAERCEAGGSAAGCPSGFSCQSAPDDETGAESVCVPTSGGFCAVAPGRRDRGAPLALATAALAWLAIRSRRRSRAHR